MKAAIVIPARLESTRLPRKLLLSETGRPLIQHTWEQACKTGLDVEIVTDSVEIMSACAQAGFGASCSLSCGEYRNGTERVAAFVQGLDDYDVIVNWQADEPCIDPSDVLEMVSEFEDDVLTPPVVTLAGLIYDEKEWRDFGRVKVAVDFMDGNRAMYFSRRPIPTSHTNGLLTYLQHVGIYVYHRMTLKSLASRTSTCLEKVESLEQLRWLGHCRFSVHTISDPPLGINTREDYDAFVERQKVMA